MSLVNDAKQFVRDAGRALETGVRQLQTGDAARALLLSSQVVGNCDMLIGVLRFLGEAAPRQFLRFSESAIPRIEEIKKAAKRIRAQSFAELFHEEVEQVAGDQAPPADPQAGQHQHDLPFDPHADNQPAHPPPAAPSEFQREPTNPGIGNQR